MVDVDHFKRFNDTTVDAGDHVLVRGARLAQARVGEAYRTAARSLRSFPREGQDECVRI